MEIIDDEMSTDIFLSNQVIKSLQDDTLSLGFSPFSMLDVRMWWQNSHNHISYFLSRVMLARVAVWLSI